MKKSFLYAITLALTTLFLTNACTKKRPYQFSQGQGGKDLLSISDWEGKEFDLDTKNELGPGNFSTTSNTTVCKASDNCSDDFDINNMPFVNYQTKAPESKDLPLRGVPNTHGIYKIRFHVYQDKIIAYKVALTPYVPIQEQTYATPLASRKQTFHAGQKILGKALSKSVTYIEYEVPIYSLSISLIKVEAVKNSDNQNTHYLNEYQARNLSEATYFRIQKGSRQQFESSLKQNLFKKNFFDSQWFYSATIIETAKQDTWFLQGVNIEQDFEMESVSRIQFDAEGSTLVVRNINIDPALMKDKKDVRLNAPPALFIPMKHVDFARAQNGLNSAMSEERFDDRNQRSKQQKDRPYVELDFGRTYSPVSVADSMKGNLAPEDFKAGQLESLTVSDNYLDFVIFYGSKNVLMRYSFSRITKGTHEQKGRVAWKKDMNKFGYFTTQRNLLIPDTETQKNVDKNTYLSRIYPKNNRIVFHFSNTTTSEDCKAAGRESVRQWNEVFNKAETGISVVLDEENPVNIGDIRYMIINCVDDQADTGSILGVGPTVTDTFSGEIVSGAANVFVKPLRDRLEANLQMYAYYYTHQAKIQSFSVPECMESTLDSIINTKTTRGFVAGSAPPASQTAAPQLSSATSNKCQIFSHLSSIDTEKKPLTSFNPQASVHSNAGAYYEAVKEDFIKEFREKCTDDYLPFLESLNRSSTDVDPRITPSNPQIQSCTNKLLYPHILDTLLHEMGHEFGLRHNFEASSDYKNIHDGQITSSIMDYLPVLDGPFVGKLGSYDIAAIAFGYANKVPVKDTNSPLGFKLANIQDSNQTIEQNFAGANSTGAQPYNFLFCTDKETTAIDSQYPYCLAGDLGKSPLEIVRNAIIKFNGIVNTYRLKLNMKFPIAGNKDLLGKYLDLTLFKPLSRTYAAWRSILADELVKRKLEPTLENISEDQLSKISEEITKNDPWKKSLYQASQLAADFFFKLAAMEDKVCLGYKPINGKWRAYAKRFTALRSELKDSTIIDCKNSKVEDNLLNLGYQWPQGFSRELGSIMDDVNYDNSQTKYSVYGQESYIFDVIGFNGIRDKAIGQLSAANVNWSKPLETSNFRPVILQEPAFRGTFNQYAKERLTEGLRVSSFIEDSGLLQNPNPVFYSNIVPLFAGNTTHTAFASDLFLSLRSSFLKSNENDVRYQSLIHTLTWGKATENTLVKERATSWTELLNTTNKEVVYTDTYGFARDIIKQKNILQSYSQLHTLIYMLQSEGSLGTLVSKSATLNPSDFMAEATVGLELLRKTNPLASLNTQRLSLFNVKEFQALLSPTAVSMAAKKAKLPDGFTNQMSRIWEAIYQDIFSQRAFNTQEASITSQPIENYLPVNSAGQLDSDIAQTNADLLDKYIDGYNEYLQDREQYDAQLQLIDSMLRSNVTGNFLTSTAR